MPQDATQPQRLLAFGTWLPPEPALQIDHAVDALRNAGEGFLLNLVTSAGRTLEAMGRAIGGQAIVRIRDLGGLRRDLAEMTLRHKSLLEETDMLRAFAAAHHGHSGRAAATAISISPMPPMRAPPKPPALPMQSQRNLELLDSDDRIAMARALNDHATFAARLPIVVGGERRMYDVHALKVAGGSAGIAIDASEATALQRGAGADGGSASPHARPVVLRRGRVRRPAAARVLQRFLSPAVGPRPRLSRRQSGRFQRARSPARRAQIARAAGLPRLEGPAARSLSRRRGRQGRLVPAGRPRAQHRHHAEPRRRRHLSVRRCHGKPRACAAVRRLITVQRETLDSLAEAVAVFGSNGRAQLFNPAFARMWKLSPTRSRSSRISIPSRRWCKPLFDDDDAWQTIRNAITGIDDRAAVPLNIERKDGSVLDCMTMPLPDGATMLTFHDITDSENVERALRERNDALETADQMKVDFVHHVSYELRSPLTTIIGFAHLMNDPGTGPLTEKQAEYVNYITSSTDALLALTNNILDLATIDAGAMTLELGPVDIRKTIEAAAEGIQDRLARERIVLKVDVAPDIGNFIGDERRIIQVLYNLLANAAGFSPPDAVIAVSARRTEHSVSFSVTDDGPGIPPDVKDKVFDWFESHANGSRHRGAGLGLSLVRSFVELHGGRVHFDSTVKRGTRVVCDFPLDQTAHRNAAE